MSALTQEVQEPFFQMEVNGEVYEIQCCPEWLKELYLQTEQDLSEYSNIEIYPNNPSFQKIETLQTFLKTRLLVLKELIFSKEGYNNKTGTLEYLENLCRHLRATRTSLKYNSHMSEYLNAVTQNQVQLLRTKYIAALAGADSAVGDILFNSQYTDLEDISDIIFAVKSHPGIPVTDSKLYSLSLISYNILTDIEASRGDVAIQALAFSS